MEHQDEHRMEVPSRKGVSRIEVLDGPTGRRCWPDEVKARIVAESLAPGARVCEVAQKYGLIARHVSQWRGLARQPPHTDYLIAELRHALYGKRS